MSMNQNFLIRISLLMGVFFAFNFLQGQPFPLSDSLNLGGWILNPHVSDEFNDSLLDRSKWWILGENGDYRNKWKGRAPGQFAAHNVRLEDGDLILTSQWEPGFDFATGKNNGVFYGGTETSADGSKPITQACVMSEAFFKYGYMEIRCKAADAPVTSSFWTTGYHSEIDMVENFGKRPIGNPRNQSEALERKYRTNMIIWDPDAPSNHQNWKVEDVLDVRVASDYLVFGFEWDSGFVKTYYNGQLMRTVTRQELEAKNQWRHDAPQELWFDSEVFYWYGLPNQADLASPAEYRIDYVRVWQKELSGPAFDALGFEGPFYFQGRSQPWWSSPASNFRLKTDKTYEGDFSLRYQGAVSPSGTYSIFSPFGSIDLPAGSNTVSMQVWLDPGTHVDEIELVLNSPWAVVPIDLSMLPKGQWVQVVEAFNRNAASNPSITGGDRLQIRVRGNDISSNTSEALFYLDNISFNTATVDVRGKNTVPFSIYPNPASDFIEITASDRGTIQLTNSLGKVVKIQAKKGLTEKLSVADLSPGIYLVTLIFAQGRATQKIWID